MVSLIRGIRFKLRTPVTIAVGAMSTALAAFTALDLAVAFMFVTFMELSAGLAAFLYFNYSSSSWVAEFLVFGQMVEYYPFGIFQWCNTFTNWCRVLGKLLTRSTQNLRLFDHL